MRTIAIDDLGVCRPVSPSVCHARGFTRIRCAKTAKQIEVLLGVKIPEGPMNIELDESSDTPRRGEGDSMRPSRNYSGYLFDNILQSRLSFCTSRVVQNTFLIDVSLTV